MDPGSRAAVAMTLGPVAVALGFACRLLNGWNGLDSVLLALLVTVTAALAQRAKFLQQGAWAAFVTIMLLPGAILLFPEGMPPRTTPSASRRSR